MIKKIIFILLACSFALANIESEFFRACLYGDDTTVRQLIELEKESLIFARDKDKNICLHIACCSKKGGNKHSLIAFLISKGANVNAQNRFYSTPLIISICNANYEAAQLLLKCPGIDPNLQDHFNYSPLHYAVIHRSPQLLSLLLTHQRTNPNFGTADGASPLHFAAMYGYKEESKILINDPRTDLNAAQHDSHYGGATPLHFAAMQAQTEIVQMMVEQKKANVNASLSQGLYAGFTPLHFAVMNPNTTHVFETIQLLVQAGADPKKVCQIGKTPSDLTEVKMIKSFLKNPKTQSVKQ